MERSLYWYIGSLHILTNTYTTTLTIKQVARKLVSSLFNRAYSIITNKDDLHKENARIKQVLKENGYRESIINKIFRRITNNHSLPQSQQLMQATDILEEETKTSINLPYVEGTSENLRHIFRSHKIRSTFYTEMTLRKLLCKPKDQVATEDKNNIVYEIDCSNCPAVYFSESKRSLKSRSDEHRRSVRNCDCDKNKLLNIAGKQIITLTGIRRKLLIGKAG